MSTELWTVIGLIVAGLFGGGGIAAIYKMRGEGAKIVVDAAQGAVVVQSGVITDLTKQISDLRTDHQAEIEELQTNHRTLKERLDVAERRASTAEQTAESAVERATIAEALAAEAEQRMRLAEFQRDAAIQVNIELKGRVEYLEGEVKGMIRRRREELAEPSIPPGVPEDRRHELEEGSDPEEGTDDFGE